MDFTFTDDQLAFKEAISRFLMTEAAPEMLRETWQSDFGRSPKLLGGIAEQGLMALSVPEALGGLAMGDVAWSLQTQELGYYCLPDVIADAGYTAASVLASLPQSEVRDQLLSGIADGSLRVAIGHEINPFVADAEPADWLVLIELGGVYAIERKYVELTRHRSIDASRLLSRVQWQKSDAICLVEGTNAQQVLQQSVDLGALSAAGQLLGLAQRMLDLSVDYVASRKQFGQPIGSFQAVKHHLADVAKAIEFAKPVLYRAAWSQENQQQNASVQISHAKLVAAKAAHLAARHGIQVHGAMGYTWEVDLQMFMKRTWALEGYWGDNAFHQARLNQHVLNLDSAHAGPELTFSDITRESTVGGA